MVQINYTGDAFSSLSRLVNFIESANTQGSGARWLTRYELFLKKRLQTPNQVSFCSNKTFYHLQLRYLYFSDWVIAFSVRKGFVLVEALLHNSRIVD